MTKTTTRLTKLEKATAVALLGEKTTAEVANMYNVSTSTINRWKKEISNTPKPETDPEPETALVPELAPEPEAISFNYGTALRSLVLRINFLKGSDFLSNADVKKIYNGNNPTKLLADTYQQGGNISTTLASKVSVYFLGSEDEAIISMVQTLLKDAYSCRSKSVYKTDPDGKRIKATDKDGKNHLIPTGIKEISYIGLCQYKKTMINGLFSIYKNNTIELDFNKIKREKANISHNNKCEGIVSKRGKKAK